MSQTPRIEDLFDLYYEDPRDYDYEDDDADLDDEEDFYDPRDYGVADSDYTDCWEYGEYGEDDPVLLDIPWDDLPHPWYG